MSYGRFIIGFAAGCGLIRLSLLVVDASATTTATAARSMDGRRACRWMRHRASGVSGAR